MKKYLPYARKYWYSFLLGPLFMVLEACGEFILPYITYTLAAVYTFVLLYYSVSVANADSLRGTALYAGSTPLTF